MFTFESHWIIELKRKKKRHIAASDTDGRPLKQTLCGMPYKIDDRKKAERGSALQFDECRKCVRMLFAAINALQQAGRLAGMSEEDAAVWASMCVHMKVGAVSN